MDGDAPASLDGFRRNFAVVAMVHALLLGGLWMAAGKRKAPPPEAITWLDGGGIVAAAEPAVPAPIEEATAESPRVEAAPEVEPAPEPEPEREPIEPPPPPEAGPDPEDIPEPKIEEKQPERKPVAAPTPAPKLKPTPTPAPQRKATPEPKPTPKPKARTTPKPKAKATPRPQVAKSATPKPKATEVASREPTTEKKDTERKETTNAETRSGNASGTVAGARPGPGSPGGSVSGAELQTYFAAVARKFKGVWDQPMVAVATGQDLVARVRIRVGANGNVLSATLVRSTGNREVDASIERAFPKFQTVPAPPAGLLRNGVMEESMDVILGL